MEGVASIELYGMRTGNCFRAAMALEEAGIPYLARWYDPRNPGDGEASYLRLNPTGKVPTLVDHGVTGGPFVLTQSNAIVVYAGERAPDRLFSENSLTGRARVFERFFYFVTDVIAPSHAGFYLRSQNEPRAVNLLTQRSLTAIENAEQFLSVWPFMAGDGFSIADIAALTIVGAMKEPAHAATRLRLCAGQQGPRHAGAAGLSRPQEHPAHGAWGLGEPSFMPRAAQGDSVEIDLVPAQVHQLGGAQAVSVKDLGLDVPLQKKISLAALSIPEVDTTSVFPEPGGRLPLGIAGCS